MIEIQGISKSYRTGSFVQRALDGVSITFRDSEFVAVLGASGSGKTTLLNILGGLDRADQGDIVINGVSTKDYSNSDWDTYRNHRIGFIFQSYNLIPHQSVVSNVELALTLSGVSRSERRQRALASLEKVGLSDHAHKRPNQLSGGQMQRVAIARALVNDPDIVLADEPTGALDTETGIQVMNLLSEIARDRLVIMVTHNPDLAQRYANRIVRLSDGRIIDDSRPVSEDETNAPHAAATAVAAGTATGASAGGIDAPIEPGGDVGKTREQISATPRESREKHGRSSMSFATALSLSFNNLMSKKGRTIMTAVAGSIGIIGIAAILALSTGVNNYIVKTEEETLSSYPLTIYKSNYDLTSMFSGGSGGSGGEDETEDGTIPTNTMMTSLFSQIQNNDLASLKEYFDSGESGIEEYVNLIQYNYDVTPNIFMADTSSGPVQLNPGTLSSMTSSTVTSSSSIGLSMDSFNEMIDNMSILEEQYDVVAGRWPESYDECILVLNSRGEVSDYTLYSLGILDPEELESMLESMMLSEDIDVPEIDIDFTYDDALSLTFKVVNACDMYQYSESSGTWTDMSGDTEFMTEAVNNGLDLKVVGVVMPSETSSAGVLTDGIAYTSSLTHYLIEQAGESEVVQAQMAQPDVDIFTGRTFDELNSDAAEALDLSSMFSVDEEVLQSAFSFDISLLSGTSIDASQIAGSLDASTIASLLSNMPEPDMSSLFADSTLTSEQLEQINQISIEIANGFLPYWYEQHPGESMTEGTDISSDVQAYLSTPEVLALMEQITAIQGQATSEQISEGISDYMENTFQPYLNQVMYTMMSQMAEGMANAMEDQMSALSALMGDAFSFDESAFASAISFSLSEEDLSSIMTGLYSSDTTSLEGNYSKMGYAELDNPNSISIYPIDFEAKDHVIEIIDAYNESMEEQGFDDRVVGYSDFVGALMSSVTDIVDMISYVLIAFVSISLVVSSIMIGIITYISVLERRKEIGILRAMGASRGNIANVFNAETVIEGLLAGVMAVLLVMLVSLPVNAVVLSNFAVENIMTLPMNYALILVLISVALTFIAGLIPSMAASRKDPVEALRSE